MGKHYNKVKCYKWTTILLVNEVRILFIVWLKAKALLILLNQTLQCIYLINNVIWSFQYEKIK